MLAERDQTPARTREVRPAYESICSQEGTNPISNRAIREYLSKLETLDIVSSIEKNHGKRGGKNKLHELAQFTESVRRGLTDLLKPSA